MNDQLPFDALASFVMLAEELHFTRAAARLHVAQPALTKRIQQLERTLGLTLFIRTRRAVRLSGHGEALLEHARAVLRSAATLGTAVDTLRAGGARRLRVGFTPSAPHHVLPAIMSAFRRSHPDITCLLSEASSDDQIVQLQEGSIDVGILRPPARQPKDLLCTTFLEEPFVALVPRLHHLSRRRRVTLIDLSNEPFVLIARRTGATVHDQILGACRAAGFTPRVAHEASSVHAVVGLVAAGCGVSILPQSAAGVGVAGVVQRPLDHTKLRTVMAVALARTERRSPAVAAFTRSVAAHFSA